MLYFLFGTLFVLADTGAQWLQKIDEQAAVTTAHMLLELEVVDSRGNTVSRKMEIWQAGDHSRLVRMQAPARLKGVGLLVTQEDNLHLFLPQYPPARRVLNSDRSDSFLGTDFAIDDLARLTYANHYSAKYIAAEKMGHQLLLVPLDSNDQRTMKIWCDEKGNLLQVEHLSADGQLLRTLKFSNYKTVNGVELAHDVSVQDVQRNRTTNARLLTSKINIGLSQELFTLSALENP